MQVEGILLTMYDDRTNLTRQVAADLREFFKDEVFTTIVPAAFAWRGAQFRQTHSCLRPPLQGRRKLYQAGQRDPRP